MIRVDSIEKRYGPQVLFSGLSWHIRPGERIGLVGPNGAGKTTLVRILAGRESPDEGSVQKAKTVRVGYLPQEVMEFDQGTILESALEGMGEVSSLEREMHRIAERLAAHPPRSEADQLTQRYGTLQERFSALGGYDLETRAKTILTGLGFDPERLDRPLHELSGGWQMRVALARLLLTEPDLLLLDEPTNHLDLESLTWLEEFLAAREGAFVVISHDRYFLNRMVGKIAELQSGQLNLFTGNYDQYVIERERRFAAVEAAARNQAKEIEKMERFVQRFRAQATKARQVQSRIKMLERMEKIEAPVRKEETVRFSFPQPPRSGQVVLDLEGLVKRYGDHTVYDGIDFRLQRGDRVGLVGPNGAGKSTLLKVLAGVLPYEGGARTMGHNVSLAYYAQHALDALDPRHTVLAAISEAADTHMQPRVRGILAAFLFDAEEWDKKVAVLSGGEKARLALAKMLLRPANLLLLDEPTNHLDLKSRSVLENALAGYGGTVCFISHDRYFINRIATSICEVDHGALEIHPGNYDEYRERKARLAAAAAGGPSGADAEHADRAVIVSTGNGRKRRPSPEGGKVRGRGRSNEATRTRPGSAGGSVDRSDAQATPTGQTATPVSGASASTDQSRGGTSAARGEVDSHDSDAAFQSRGGGRRSREQKRREAEARQRFSMATRDLKKKMEKLETRIADDEKRLKLVEYEMTQPATYQNPAKAQSAARLREEIQFRLGDLTHEWETLGEELQTAEARLREELDTIAAD